MSLPFSVADLEAAVVEGDVTKRPHPTLPLWIYNYGPEVQFKNKWNDVTLNCRGLILDEDYNIVARPWKKFFNLGQVDLPIQLTDPVEVMDKADGSLGILYPVVHPEGLDVNWAIATRGSFVSEQAIHATAVWNNRYSHLLPEAGLTFLYEIVYPENRIVLNYDGMDDLILLGAVENKTGFYISPMVAKNMFKDRETKDYVEWSGPVVEVFNFKTISDALGHMDRANAEGYVIRSHNFMVKLKQPDYLDLHRLVTNMTPKSIWEKLRDGQSVSQICADLPDEFHSMAEDFAKPLRERYNERLEEILEGYHRMNLSLSVHSSRKDRARKYKQSQDARYYFLLFDWKPINEVLWNELKPREATKENIDA